MALVEKYPCLGCSRLIPVVKGKRRRKYHNWACYAKKAAPSWGMSQAEVKKKAKLVEYVNGLVRSGAIRP